MINGIINILKPTGMTSADVVYWLRRKLQTKKLGHTGTLDPGVAGVLPICVGKATRLAEYLTEQGKAYRAEVLFGLSTTTQDGYGQVLKNRPANHLRAKDLLAILPDFMGNIQQLPPMHSAVRQGGRHLYEYARAGVEVERKSREVTIKKLELLEWLEEDKPRAVIDIDCSKGTYVRTLCHDIGEALGCGAHMSYLLRTRSGPFKLEDSLTLEEINYFVSKQDSSFLLPLTTGLDLPVIELEKERVQAFQNGLPTYLEANGQRYEDGSHFQVYGQGNLLGIGIWQEGQIHPHKVL